MLIKSRVSHQAQSVPLLSMLLVASKLLGAGSKPSWPGWQSHPPLEKALLQRKQLSIPSSCLATACRAIKRKEVKISKAGLKKKSLYSSGRKKLGKSDHFCPRMGNPSGWVCWREQGARAPTLQRHSSFPISWAPGVLCPPHSWDSSGDSPR